MGTNGLMLNVQLSPEERGVPPELAEQYTQTQQEVLEIMRQLASDNDISSYELISSVMNYGDGVGGNRGAELAHLSWWLNEPEQVDDCGHNRKSFMIGLAMGAWAATDTIVRSVEEPSTEIDLNDFNFYA